MFASLQSLYTRSKHTPTSLDKGFLILFLGFLLLYTQVGCLSEGYVCTTRTDCPKGRICLEGLCTTCRTSKDCAALEYCKADLCHAQRTQTEFHSSDAAPTEAKSPTEETSEVSPTRCIAGQSRMCYPSTLSGCKASTTPHTYNCLGLCKQGQQRCNASGEWGPCTDFTEPQAEQCNGKDDNCDGQVDNECTCTVGEHKACYTKDRKTLGIGECKAGMMLCLTNQSWGPCQRAIYPQPEVCDGKDNDCNGKIDDIRKNNTSCRVSGKHGECQKGHSTCAKGRLICHSKTNPTPEICDGKDNDCNGKIDDTPKGCTCIQGQKRTCGHSVGECKTGTQTCTSNGTWATCFGASEPTPEICDGKDNDCDGKIDNQTKSAAPLSRSCYQGPPKARNVGICKSGTQTCTLGKWGLCTGQIFPSVEVPGSGKDENCDGKSAPISQACVDGSVEQIWPSRKMIGCDCKQTPCKASTAQNLCAPGWAICNVTDWTKNYAKTDSNKVRYVAAVMQNCHSTNICPCQNQGYTCSTTPVRLKNAQNRALCAFSCKSNGGKNYYWPFFVGPSTLLNHGLDACGDNWKNARSFVPGIIGRGSAQSISTIHTKNACLNQTFTFGLTPTGSGVVCCRP